METHRSTQLFLYCSGGERSVKYVYIALEMETSKGKQSGVVRFLVAEGAATRYKIKTHWNAVGRNLPLHDNARPHTVNVLRNKLQIFGLKPFNTHRTA